MPPDPGASSAPSAASLALVVTAATSAVLAVLSSACIVWRCRRGRTRGTRGVELEPRESKAKPPKRRRGGEARLAASEDTATGEQPEGLVATPNRGGVRRSDSETTKLNAKVESAYELD